MSDVNQERIPDGYKHTEVGIIPDDWNLSSINEISSVPMQNGLFYEPARKGKGGSIINVGDLYKSAPINVDLLELFDATESEFKVFQVEVGDLFFTRSSIVPSGIAHCNIHMPADHGRRVVFDSHLIRVRVKPEYNDPRYIYLACLSKVARKHLIGSAKTATMTTIDQGSIKTCPILIPSKKEQTVIANALSDVDVLITSLEKLIAKKRDIKTAAMQQLLTGKKRLPPFDAGNDVSKEEVNGEEAVGQTRSGYKQTELGEIPEDWEVKSYGQVFKFLNTASNSRSDLWDGGDCSYIHYGDIHMKWNFLVDFNANQIPKIDCCKVKNSSLLQDGDLIVADASEDYDGIGKSVEVIGLGDGVAVAGLHTFLLRDTGVYVDGYRGYLHKIRSTKLSFDKLATGLKVYGLSKGSLKSILLPVPPKKEQLLIVEALSGMQNEVDAIEQRLNKTKKLKQGMMQELLTGRTRLV